MFDVPGNDPSTPSEALRFLSVSGIQLNLDGIQLRAGDARAELNVTEFRLLRELMTNAGRVMTRDQLFQAVWGEPGQAYADIVEDTISRLRRRLRQVGASASLIRTVRRVGYVFEFTDVSEHGRH
jgi:DNA-binding response OmpR family regulator